MRCNLRVDYAPGGLEGVGRDERRLDRFMDTGDGLNAYKVQELCAEGQWE